MKSAAPSAPTASAPAKTRKLSDLEIVDHFTKELIADPLTPTSPLPYSSLTLSSEKIDNTPVDDQVTERIVKTSRLVKNSFFTYLTPTRPQTKFQLAFSLNGMAILDLDSKREFELLENSHFEKVFSGQVLLGDKAKPWCANYGGHQFGFYSGQLGDGRCLSIATVLNLKQEIWEIQLKGAGKTPYSRFGDGYCTLSSSIREYLCSEMMDRLGVPTTKVLSLIVGGKIIHRQSDEFNGIITRLAPSFIRFGTFELFWYRGEPENVKLLSNFVIKHNYPALNTQDHPQDETKPENYITIPLRPTPIPTPNPFPTPHDENPQILAPLKEINFRLNRYSKLLQEIVKSTAKMIAHWQAVGFCHGVMNTDNMSILGLTMDYGPFGFMDIYDPGWNSNASDPINRYKFSSQPNIALWNLSKLGRTFTDLVFHPLSDGKRVLPADIPTTNLPIKPTDIIKVILKEFEPTFLTTYLDLMSKKLGFKAPLDTDMECIITPLLQLLTECQVDYTIFFRLLCDFKLSAFEKSFLESNACTNLIMSGIKMVQMGQGVIPTPSVSQSNLQAAMSGANEMKDNLPKTTTTTTTSDNAQNGSPLTPTFPDSPVKEDYVPSISDIRERWKVWTTAYKMRVEGEQKVSEISDAQRSILMKKVNPKFALRNYILDDVCRDVNEKMLAASTMGNKMEANACRLEAREMVERVVRVLIGDLYGEVSEGAEGWKDGEYKKQSEVWSHFVYDQEDANIRVECFS